MLSSHLRVTTALIVFLAVLVGTAFPQAVSRPPFDKNGVVVDNGPANTVTWSPADLGFNAAAFGSNATISGARVSMVGVRAFTLYGVCTQNGTLFQDVLAEDGTTVLAGNQIGTITGGTAFMYFVGTELTPSVINVGTPNTAFRLPAAGLLFKYTNTNASAGTCTIRLVNSYK